MEVSPGPERNRWTFWYSSATIFRLCTRSDANASLDSGTNEACCENARWWCATTIYFQLLIYFDQNIKTENVCQTDKKSVNKTDIKWV